MNQTLHSNYYYKTKTQVNSEHIVTENIFENENIFEARHAAFRFVAHLLEILFEANKLTFESKVLHPTQVEAIIHEMKNDNFSFPDFLNDSRFLAIDLIPDTIQFPNGIELFFVANDQEYLIQSYRQPKDIQFTQIIENLRFEYHCFLKEGYNLHSEEISIKTDMLKCCNHKEEISIINTYYGWNSPIRILGINLLYNSQAYTDKIIELMMNPNFEEIAFLESWKWKEIKTNILSLHHTKGGILFMGYHPENFTEHIIHPTEIEETIASLNEYIKTNLDCKDSIEVRKITFQGFDIIAIIVFPISKNNYKKLIENNRPIYSRTHDKIVIGRQSNQENNNLLNSNLL